MATSFYLLRLEGSDLIGVQRLAYRGYADVKGSTLVFQGQMLDVPGGSYRDDHWFEQGVDRLDITELVFQGQLPGGGTRVVRLPTPITLLTSGTRGPIVSCDVRLTRKDLTDSAGKVIDREWSCLARVFWRDGGMLNSGEKLLEPVTDRESSPPRAKGAGRSKSK